MFNRNNPGNSGTARLGDDTSGPPLPQIPPHRTYEVMRLTTEGELVTLSIQAHECRAASDNLLFFLEYIIDPVIGPRERVVRAVNGWEEYREVPTTPALPSVLIPPPGSLGVN